MDNFFIQTPRNGLLNLPLCTYVITQYMDQDYSRRKSVTIMHIYIYLDF